MPGRSNSVSEWNGGQILYACCGQLGRPKRSRPAAEVFNPALAAIVTVLRSLLFQSSKAPLHKHSPEIEHFVLPAIAMEVEALPTPLKPARVRKYGSRKDGTLVHLLLLLRITACARFAIPTVHRLMHASALAFERPDGELSSRPASGRSWKG